MFMRVCFLLLAFVLTSCSGRKEEARSLVHEIPTSSVRAALQIADSAKLECADKNACPESVGLFLGANSSSLSTCTAFLVAEDTVATNSHCIPSAVKLMPDLCAERVRVIFPANKDRVEETFGCESLLFQSERPNEISPDLALFRVKKTGRMALPLDQSGVKPSENFTAYKMNPGPGATGTIVKQSCLSVPGSYRFPLYQGQSDSIFVTGDCPSIPGNSGAPLLSADGALVGLFQAELALDDSQKKEWSPYLSEGEDFAPLALGTSLGCLENGRLRDRCVPIDPEEIPRPNIHDFLEELEPRIQVLARSFKHNVFEWQASVSRRRLLETEFSLEPGCLRPLDGWLFEHLLLASEPLFQEKAIVGARLPRIRATMQFNRYMQVSTALRAEPGEKREFLIHPQKIYETGADGELGLCPVTEPN